MRLRAPEVPERSPARSRPRSRRCAGSSSTSRRASPRRSTGPQALADARARRELDERSVDVDARHDPQVPRGPGARARARPRRARAHGAWRAVPDAVGRRDRAERDRGRVRARCCAAPGSTCRSAATLDVRRGARRASGSPTATRRVLGGPGDARAPPRGHRASTTARSPRSGTRRRARRRRRAERRRGRDSRSTSDGDDDAPTPTTTTPTPTRPIVTRALEPGRDPAPQGLRAVHAAPSSPRRAG